MFLSSIFSSVLAFSQHVQEPIMRNPNLPVSLRVGANDQNRFMSFRQPSKVFLPHRNPTKSFWTHGSPDANPLSKEGSEGNLTTDADIVIIGSGITGVGSAYHLSQMLNTKDVGLDILILEARDFCSGATGRNGGHLTPTAFLGFRSIAETYNTTEALRWLSLENHTTESLLSILTSSKSGLQPQVDLVNGDHLDLFFSDAAEREAKAHWTAAHEAGVDLHRVEFLSKEETETKYGPAFPSVRYGGHNLWPLKAVTHLFHLTLDTLAASKFDSKIHLHTQTPVTSVKRLEPNFIPKATVLPRRWLLETPRGSVHTHTVIHATNGYAAHLLPFLAASPGRESIVPTRGQVIATLPSVGTEKLLKNSYSANDGYEYWFPRPINQSTSNNSSTKPLVILGGGREVAGPDHELGITDDSVVNPSVSKILKQFLPSIYPEGWFERDKTPEMEWSGIMGYTKSRDPLVGPVVDTEHGRVLEGQYIAAGYSGHGMPRAFGCAEALAQIVLSDLTNKTWTSPEWFPNHFLTTSKWRLSNTMSNLLKGDRQV